MGSGIYSLGTGAMFAAQAILEGWTLVTRDRAFSTLTGITTLW